MKRTISLIIILTLLIPFTFLSCSEKEQEIKIGVILPLTGDAAIYGTPHKEGIELAISEINTKGYLNNYILYPIFEDSQANPKITIAAFNKLIKIDKVKLVIGDMFSATTLAIAPIAERSRITLLSPTSAAEEVPNAGEYVFSIYPTDTLDGRFIANIAIKCKYKTAAILYVQADAMINAKNSFKKYFEKNGGSVLIDEGFQEQEKDFRQILNKCKNHNPDIIFLPAYLEEIVLILIQAKELGLKNNFVSISTAYDEKIFKLAGNAAEGLIFSVPFYDISLKEPEIISFIKLYKEKYNKEPNIWAAYGYDAIKIVSLAIKNCLIKNSTIREELLKIKNYPGVTGTTTFLENGSVDKPLRMMIVKDKNFMPLN
jgi:branched-chain amino acid transport system substrate-binding protein